MRSAFVALALAAIGLGACNSQPLCLNCTGASFVDMLYVPPDLSGADSAVPPDGGVCDPTMLSTDPNHCGTCATFCSRSHAVPACVGGMCEFTCDVGFVDLDGNAANDCEYACLATGPEQCDGIDNDCNGLIDDGFDLMTDTQNCGQCGNACSVVNGVATCSMGMCGESGCDPGYKDLDPTVPGCEYHCPVFPPLTKESCNGVDDNCDGQIDEAAALQPPAAGYCNTLAGTPCATSAAVCETRNMVTTYYCHYGAGVEYDPDVPNGIALAETKCDGIDGDCDGHVDGSFTGLGGQCDNGLKGICRDLGKIVCDSTQTTTACDLTVLPDATPGAPFQEKCNNLDDDCDGVVDNKTGSLGLHEDMVKITKVAPVTADFWIDRYEASRPDATAVSAGTANARSCSNSNALPWTQVSFTTASAACTAAGLRLCTNNEWQLACATAAGNMYPYGNTYVGATCNGADYQATPAVEPTGNEAMCVQKGSTIATSVYDLSGNVKEWTSDVTGMTTSAPAQNIYATRGGSYLSPSLGLTCQTTFSQAASNESLTDLGFRCCLDGTKTP